MKNLVLAALQFVLFLLMFIAGSFLTPFHTRWFVTHPTPFSTRYFIADGLLLMLALFLLVLVLEAAFKRLRTMASWTTGALLLATLLGFAMKLGFITREL